MRKRTRPSKAWRARKVDYMFDSFGYLSKGGRGQLKKIPDARFRGHKTPRAENLFDRYEAHFHATGLQPRYFYCARNPFDCWRSYKQASWNSHERVESFIAQYMESFAQLAEMQRRAGERVIVLNLDDLIAAPEPMAWYREHIFAPLGLDTPNGTIQRIGKFEAAKGASGKSDLERGRGKNHFPPPRHGGDHRGGVRTPRYRIASLKKSTQSLCDCAIACGLWRMMTSPPLPRRSTMSSAGISVTILGWPHRQRASRPEPMRRLCPQSAGNGRSNIPLAQ